MVYNIGLLRYRDQKIRVCGKDSITFIKNCKSQTEKHGYLVQRFSDIDITEITEKISIIFVLKHIFDLWRPIKNIIMFLISIQVYMKLENKFAE